MIVIKDGINFAKVYADKAFDKWGTPTTEQLHIVEQWTDIDIPATAEKIDANWLNTNSFHASNIKISN